LKQHIIIVGAGVVGAAVSFHLANSARVTVISSAAPRATDASFGWINASFYHDHAHYRLRHAAITAFEGLMVDGIIPVQRQSSLCWEVAGTTFDEQLAELKSLGADVRAVDACTFRTLEPHVAEVPDRAMLFPNEAVASSGDLADALLTTNQARGARHVTGVSVTGLLVTNGRVTGVYTDAGDIAADQVLVAAGTGTAELMKATGINIPMLRRPGAVVKTRLPRQGKRYGNYPAVLSWHLLLRRTKVIIVKV